VLSAIAIIPSAPVMVPELAANAAEELAGLRQAVFAAAGSLPSRWVAVGVGAADALLGPDRTGTFAGYGVDRRVTLSPRAGDPPTELPLCALIAGWVRCQAKPEARAEVRVYAADHDVDAALARGRRLPPRSTGRSIRPVCSSSPTARTLSPRPRPAATTPTRYPPRPR